MARYAATELGEKNIRVNVVSGGPIETDALRAFTNYEEVRDKNGRAKPTRAHGAAQRFSRRTSNTDEKDIIVYVTGAIQSPGLYKLSSVSTVGDVIKGAGGALPYADVEAINLAETVQGGQHVHIKFNFHGNPEALLRNQKININTASVKELDALPGIGPTMAKRIEEYRQSKGGFYIHRGY